MELAETIENINKQLVDLFGIDTATTNPIWRVVWSEEQFEHRLGTYTDITPAGLFVREVTEVRYVPKYRQWIKEKYVLERLVAIPEQNLIDLPATKMSYEPIWVFQDKNENYLPPRIDACKFIIDTVYAAQYGTKNLKKYHDPDNSQEAELTNRRKRVDGIIDELFGDQSSLAGTTKTGETIIVPRNYEKVN
jgi:hypothetical protein